MNHHECIHLFTVSLPKVMAGSTNQDHTPLYNTGNCEGGFTSMTLCVYFTVTSALSGRSLTGVFLFSCSHSFTCKNGPTFPFP